MSVAFDVPLAPLTTVKLGGRAAKLLTADRESDLVEAVAAGDAAQESILILGGGSNMVISDDGFPGLVIRVACRGIEAELVGGGGIRVRVAAGEPLADSVAHAVDRGWSGIETLAGIPGLMGATPVQNVGAYGSDIAHVVQAVHVYDRQCRQRVTLAAASCGFGYRQSVFRQSSRYVILGVTMLLTHDKDAAPIRYAELARALGVTVGVRAPLRAVHAAVLALRRSKGMVVDDNDPESVSVGSFFKNPVLSTQAFSALESRVQRDTTTPTAQHLPHFNDGQTVKVPAAWLIEQAGFGKGYQKGTVGISRKHALALVHRGGGTAQELLALAREIRAAVQQRFDLTLEAEPVLVGLKL